jgi:phage gp29-like protein
MATEQDTTPPAPPLGEIAPIDDGLSPLRLDSLKASDPFIALLEPTDSVLQSKGGIANLKIYTELLRDDQVASTWAQRRLALTSCETVVEAGAKDAASKQAAVELQAELDAINWDDITDKALYAAFFGWGVAEVMWRPEGDRVRFDRILVRDRARFRFDRERALHLWTTGSSWRQMPERKFWPVVSGGDNHDQLYGLGIANALFWPVFFKRNDIKFWLIFLEKFGMPTAIGKMTAGQLDDPEQRKKGLAMLRQIATDAGVLVPVNDKGEAIVELLEAARSGAADYESLQRVMNEAISKVVMGQTMTTDNGASLSQAKVHAGVAQKIVSADADLLCGSFNQGPVKWWTEWNFPGAMPPRVYRHTDPQEDLNARAERDGKIKALGYEPTEEYVRETYGDGWVKSKAPVQAPGMPPMGAPGGDPNAQFAEGEVAALQAMRAARRGDQKALADAAVMFAEQYQTIMGRQVGAILQAAEDSGDPEVFRRRLDELLEQQPAPELIDKVNRAGIFARMLGALRQQRRAA